MNYEIDKNTIVAGRDPKTMILIIGRLIDYNPESKLYTILCNNHKNECRVPGYLLVDEVEIDNGKK